MVMLDDFQLSVVYVIVTFLIVDRELVTFVATITTSVEVGAVGLITGGRIVVTDVGA